MNQSKVHSNGNVPLPWENKPDVRKETNQQLYFLQVQPPRPPYVPETAPTTSVHDVKLPPPPPCAYHSLTKCSSRRGFNKKCDDPFLAAYKECTKSSGKAKLAKKDGGGGGCSGLMKGLFNFSCKKTCGVRNDNLVKISQPVLQKDGSNRG
ncbi:hypothetical protein HRI_003924900 [Hibiscus trionum]|uniref:Uncharacterized protein n=1 Tax=Hibiscus trionum TaxID=183268 RepID=A0A9W7IUG1_HIBTR|nr:hypothetical protein HRI_003924900 [Hibiscus trionum]